MRKEQNRVERKQQFFTIKEAPRRGIRVTPKQDQIDIALRKSGFFAIITNEALSSERVLLIYRTRDAVEKAFYDTRHRLDGKRSTVSTEPTLAGKFIIEFVALIYVS